MAPWEDYLKTIYFDPSHTASFSGPQKLYHVVKKEGKYDISMSKIRQFLHNQEAYSLHKPVRRRLKRNHVISAGKDDVWMADLIDMVKFAEWNQGYKYLLLVIDTFSKYVWIEPLKSKTGDEVVKGFRKIFETSGRSPAKLITDKGQEFRANTVQDVMRKAEVRYFPSQNETKASTSERAILTIKQKLYRYLTHEDSNNYLPVLQDIAENYNKTYHRTIGMSPSDVKENNQEEVRLATYFAQNPRKKRISEKRDEKLKPFKLKIGDYVRITHLRTIYTRAYDFTFSGEMFKIYKRYHRGTLPIYRLQDMQDEEIKGTFYESELQKVDINPDKLWKIDKILKTKGRGPNKQHFVKWKYYPKKFNSWVKAGDFV